MLLLIDKKNGFSLIEVAIVMVIMGILAGGGISMMRTLTERKFRNEASEYMKEVKEALITYSDINGTLPLADTDGDGEGNTGETEGFLPYLDLGVKPADPYKNVLKYEINTNLGTDRSTSCESLRLGLSGDPVIVDVDGSTTSFPVAAVIVSSGKSNADSNGDWFDDITSSVTGHLGDNSDGNPNYIRSFPLPDFDDFVMYIGGNELYGEFCEFLDLSVNNASGSTVYVWNQTLGIDLVTGGLGSPDIRNFKIISGTEIRLMDGANGTGSTVSGSEPLTPIILSGAGCTINLPSLVLANLDYMKEVEDALISYAVINKKLPFADTTNNGEGNTGETEGTLPYLDLGVKPADPYKKVLRYEINNGLYTDNATTCLTLASPLSGYPLVVDEDDVSAAQLSVAAVIVSSGPSNADNSGDWFDDITTGSHQGDNSDGRPRYIRSGQTSDFDDLVLYVGQYMLPSTICD